jgi:D-aspartate ligase
MTIRDTSTPVVLLRLFGHCGVGIARSLGRLGVPVYAVDADPRAPAARSRYLRRLYPWDIDREPPEATVERLVKVARELGGRPILIPTGDMANLLVDDHAEALAARFRLPAQPAGLTRRVYSKRGLYELCREHGLATAETEFPSGLDDVEAFAARTRFPVMLKGIDPRRLQQRSGRRLALAHDAGELLALYRELEDPAEPNLMLQEYIPGTDADSWMMDAYFDRDGRCAFGVTARKLRQYPAEGGVTSLGVCEANPELRAEVERFAQVLGYRGILDTGYRFDARDGRYKLLDPNPRIGSSFRLFVSPEGMDVARALYLDMTDQPVPAAAHPDGRRWFAEHSEARRAARKLRRGRGARRLPGWAASFRGVQETAWFARDDRRPFLAMCRELARSALQSVARRRGSASQAAHSPASAVPVKGGSAT